MFAPKVLRLDLMAIGRAWSAACKRPYFYSPAQRPIFETAQEPQRLLAGTWLMCFPGTGSLSAWHA